MLAKRRSEQLFTVRWRARGAVGFQGRPKCRHLVLPSVAPPRRPPCAVPTRPARCVSGFWTRQVYANIKGGLFPDTTASCPSQPWSASPHKHEPPRPVGSGVVLAPGSKNEKLSPRGYVCTWNLLLPLVRRSNQPSYFFLTCPAPPATSRPALPSQISPRCALFRPAMPRPACLVSTVLVRKVILRRTAKWRGRLGHDCSPGECSFSAPSTASKTHGLNVSQESRTSKIICKPMAEQSPQLTTCS